MVKLFQKWSREFGIEGSSDKETFTNKNEASA